MLNLLIPYFGYSPWIIHRLDMRTSGARCCARQPNTRADVVVGWIYPLYESRMHAGQPAKEEK